MEFVCFPLTVRVNSGNSRAGNSRLPPPTNAWRLLIPVTGKAVGLSCPALLLRAPLTFAFALSAVAAADAVFTGVGRGSRDGKTTPSLTGEFLAGFDLD